MLAMTCKSSNNPNEALTNRPIMNPERAISAAVYCAGGILPIHNTADTRNNCQGQKKTLTSIGESFQERKKGKGCQDKTKDHSSHDIPI
jgi:hypothetical protein